MDSTTSSIASISYWEIPLHNRARKTVRNGRRSSKARPSARAFNQAAPGEVFTPQQPQTIQESGISSALLERLIMKYMFQVGRAPGRGIAGQMKLSFKVIEPIMKQLRSDKQIDLSGTTNTGGSEYVITEVGRERVQETADQCPSASLLFGGQTSP